jgi:hypothetical protein
MATQAKTIPAPTNPKEAATKEKYEIAREKLMEDIKKKRRASISQFHLGPFDGLTDAIPDIESGEDVWIVLDDTGTPISVQREAPDPGVSCCRGHINDLYDNTIHHLVTNTGAELWPPVASRPEVRFATPVPPPPEPLSRGGETQRKER